MQVKGKDRLVEIYSVSPRPNSQHAGGWMTLKPKRNMVLDRIGRQRRTKRSSVIIDAVLEAKSVGKMKPLIGRQLQLEKV